MAMADYASRRGVEVRHMTRRDLENGPIKPGKRDKGGRNESPSKVLTRPPPPQPYDTVLVTLHRTLKAALAAQVERMKK